MAQKPDKIIHWNSTTDEQKADIENSLMACFTFEKGDDRGYHNSYEYDFFAMRMIADEYGEFDDYYSNEEPDNEELDGEYEDWIIRHLPWDISGDWLNGLHIPDSYYENTLRDCIYEAENSSTENIYKTVRAMITAYDEAPPYCAPTQRNMDDVVRILCEKHSEAIEKLRTFDHDRFISIYEEDEDNVWLERKDWVRIAKVCGEESLRIATEVGSDRPATTENKITELIRKCFDFRPDHQYEYDKDALRRIVQRYSEDEFEDDNGQTLLWIMKHLPEGFEGTDLDNLVIPDHYFPEDDEVDDVDDGMQ